MTFLKNIFNIKVFFMVFSITFIDNCNAILPHRLNYNAINNGNNAVINGANFIAIAIMRCNMCVKQINKAFILHIKYILTLMQYRYYTFMRLSFADKKKYYAVLSEWCNVS